MFHEGPPNESNQGNFVSLVTSTTAINEQKGVIRKTFARYDCPSGVKSSGGMGCEREWIIWVFLKIGTTYCRQEAPAKIAGTMHLSRQLIREVNSANGQCGLTKASDRVALDESNR